MLAETESPSQGFSVQENRTLLEVSGRDAATHLQRFCTNDLAKLPAGHGREAMFLNTKGKVLGFVEVFCLEERWLLYGHGQQAEVLANHLDRYVIREDVHFRDLSAESSFLAVFGEAACAALDQLGWTRPAAMPGCNSASNNSYVIRSRELGPTAVWVAGPQTEVAALQASLLAAGLLQADSLVLERQRIREQYPHFGIDITDGNLPQELQRDEVAISFTKGCYLGQETVARIDALGHVNRLVCGLQGDGSAPSTLPCDIQQADQNVGQLTSLAVQPQGNGWIGLGTLKRSPAAGGTTVEIQGASATVLPTAKWTVTT